MFTIRHATPADLPVMLAIYDAARNFMRQHDNPTQWKPDYPGEAALLQDMQRGESYLCEQDGVPVGTFMYTLAGEITYQVIEQGDWHYKDETYGTVHRVASAGVVKGVGTAVFDFCKSLCPCVRVDTHRDNYVMQSLAEKNGFSYCGIIYLLNGEERLAYDWHC